MLIVLTLCSQRIFLLKRLRDQGLNYRQLDTVFRWCQKVQPITTHKTDTCIEKY